MSRQWKITVTEMLEISVQGLTCHTPWQQLHDYDARETHHNYGVLFCACLCLQSNQTRRGGEIPVDIEYRFVAATWLHVLRNVGRNNGTGRDYTE